MSNIINVISACSLASFTIRLQKHAIDAPCLGLCPRRRFSIPNYLLRVCRRDVEYQEISFYIVSQMTVRLIYTTQVVEVTTLSEWLGLIGVLKQGRRLTWKVDKTLWHIEALRNSLRMLLGCDKSAHGLSSMN